MSYRRKKESMLKGEAGQFQDFEELLATGQINIDEYWKNLEEEYKESWHYVNFLESFAKSV
jgi:hypothetical protein